MVLFCHLRQIIRMVSDPDFFKVQIRIGGKTRILSDQHCSGLFTATNLRLAWFLECKTIGGGRTPRQASSHREPRGAAGLTVNLRQEKEAFSTKFYLTCSWPRRMASRNPCSSRDRFTSTFFSLSDIKRIIQKECVNEINQ